MRYTIFFFFLLFFSCKKKIAQSFLEIRAEGKQTHSKVVSLSAQDILGNNQRIPIQEGKSITQLTNFTFPQIFIYSTGFFEFNPIFVRNNKLHLNIVKDTILSTDTLLSKESSFIKHLDVIFSFLGKTTDGKTWWKDKKDYNRSVKLFSIYYKNQLFYVDSIFAKSYYRQDFQDFIRKELKLNYFSSMLEPFIYGNLDSNSTKYIESVYLLKDSIINLLDLKKGVHHAEKQIVYDYNKFLCRNWIGSTKQFKIQWDTAQAVFKGETKEYLLFKLILDNFNDVRNNLDIYKNKIRNPIYTYYLDSLSKKNNYVFGSSELNQIVFDTLQKAKLFSDILKENKGNLIYVDFWASWCVPCRKEMSFYKDLQYFFDNNKINVIFMSIDTDEQAWKRGIEKTQTKRYFHYMLPAKSALHQLINLSEIPRYILISKNGKLIEINAPRPSQKELLLKQLKIIQKQ